MGPRVAASESRPVRPCAHWLRALVIGVCLLEVQCAGAGDLPAFDFQTDAGAQGWLATRDISGMDRTAEGLRVQISGNDPYLMGPARDYPAGVPLWLRLRLNSEQGG